MVKILDFLSASKINPNTENVNPQIKRKGGGHLLEMHMKFQFQILATATIQFVKHFYLKKMPTEDQWPSSILASSTSERDLNRIAYYQNSLIILKRFLQLHKRGQLSTAICVKCGISNFSCIYANKRNLRFKDGSKLLFGFLNFFFCLFFDRSSEFPSSSSSRARFPRTPFSVAPFSLAPFSLHLSFGLKQWTSVSGLRGRGRCSLATVLVTEVCGNCKPCHHG